MPVNITCPIIFCYTGLNESKWLKLQSAIRYIIYLITELRRLTSDDDDEGTSNYPIFDILWKVSSAGL